VPNSLPFVSERPPVCANGAAKSNQNDWLRNERCAESHDRIGPSHLEEVLRPDAESMEVAGELAVAHRVLDETLQLEFQVGVQVPVQHDFERVCLSTHNDARVEIQMRDTRGNLEGAPLSPPRDFLRFSCGHATSPQPFPAASRAASLTCGLARTAFASAKSTQGTCSRNVRILPLIPMHFLRTYS
jgi:hypothetical protein